MNSTRKSLFQRILASFVILIIIFALFDLLIFQLVKSNLRSEMINQNNLTLQKVVERYHLQFERVKEALFDEFTDRDVITLNSQVISKTDTNMLKTRPVVEDIQIIASNPNLFLENMILLFRSTSLSIDKNGPGKDADLFSGLYTSDSYPVSYWKTQFQRESNFVLHPAASFLGPSDKVQKKTLIPYSIKPPMADDLLIAMIDAQRLQAAVPAGQPGLSLVILGPDHSIIYKTDNDSPEIPEQLLSAALAKNGEKDYILKDGIYYFDYREHDQDGLHYIMAVSNPDFTAKIHRLDKTMIFLLILSIFMALVVSIFFSKRIYKPVRQLLTLISDPRETGILQSQIHEIDLISHKIRALLKEKERIRQELEQQQSVLTSYHYINKLKNIDHELNEWHSIQGAEENFTIVLYELRFRPASFVDIPVNRKQVSQAIGEHIKLVADEHFPDSHTFQMESHQFLSVIPGNERERIIPMLKEMKQALDRDRSCCLVTAAVSSWFGHSAQLGHAYRQVQDMALQAGLLEEMQIVHEYRSDRLNFALTLAQEQELTTALKAGNEQDLVSLASRWLKELHQKEASVQMFRHFANVVTDKAQKILEHYKVEANNSWQLKPIMLQLEECCTLSEYKETFQAYFHAVAKLIRDKKEADDPIIDHVLGVIQGHYAEDLSLDVLADQLNLSTSYLSSYIKEKTGVNFIEHLHDIRVKKAEELLLSTDMNMQEIGIRVGYQNISSFNRMFKSRTGSSPGNYRKTSLMGKIL